MTTTIAYTAVPSPEHDHPNHPENSARVPAILDGLAQAGLLESLQALEYAPATRQQVARCHDETYIAALERRASWGPAIIDPAPTYVTSGSFQAALNAVGGALAAVDAVLGTANRALALVRPPGHHALPHRAMGFCLFNNIALVARHAQGRGIQRVAIIDFDVHHGNGTQTMFYTDPTVYFASTHQQGIYPGNGSAAEMGAEEGKGFTLNIPLPAGAGDQVMAQVTDEVIVPAMARFQPELVLVSAGFDAHFLDPLAGLQLTGAGYHRLAGTLADIASRWAEGRIVFLLEGGYDLTALANGVVNVVRALRGEGPRLTPGKALHPEPDVHELVERLQAQHGL